MSESFVKLSKEGSVGIITLDRPPANSYEFAFWNDFETVVNTIEADDEIKVALIVSDSKKFFCAGSDIHVFAANTTEENLRMIKLSRRVYDKMTAIPKIFIAVINGHALGGGLELALACDLRFAGDGHFLLGLPEVKLGLLPGSGGTQRLARLIGAAKALELIVTGKTFNSQRALELGVIHELFPQDRLRENALTYANELASGATLAMGHIKRAINNGISMDLTAGLALELELMSELLFSEDATEGFNAFREKRKAAFKGK